MRISSRRRTASIVVSIVGLAGCSTNGGTSQPVLPANVETASTIASTVAPSSSSAPTPQVSMPTEDADGTSKFLLTDDEMPANWTLKSVRAHEPDELDSALVESCSAMRALHDLDRLLAWQATWEDADDGVARNFVGRTDDPISAAAWIDELADADCDLSAIGGRVDAQPVAIASTDAAVTLSLASTSGDNGTNLVVWLTGDLVFMVVVERPRVTSSDEVMRLAERAALDVIAH